MFKHISLSLLALALFLSPVSSLSAHAATPTDYRVVSTTKGLTVRNSKCTKVGTVAYATILSPNSTKTITCKVNGVNQKMINYYNTYGTGDNDVYVASAFTEKLLVGNFDPNKATVQVNAIGGLNLRDKNCKRVTSVPNKTTLTLPTGLGGSIDMCQRGGKFYSMSAVNYKGNMYYVADVFLK